MPKFKFLESKGISRTDIAKILSTAPAIFKKKIREPNNPIFQFPYQFSAIQGDGVIAAIKRFGGLLLSDVRTCVQPNIKILRRD